jgi:hypothetical protein
MAKKPSTEGQIESLREVAIGLYNLAAAMKYETDAGEPHPLKDGVYDRAMQRARDAMPDYFSGDGHPFDFAHGAPAMNDCQDEWTDVNATDRHPGLGVTDGEWWGALLVMAAVTIAAVAGFLMLF